MLSLLLLCIFLFLIFIRQIIYSIEFGDKFENKYLLEKFNLLLGPLIYLPIEFIVFLAMLVLIDQQNEFLIEDQILEMKEF